MTQANVGEVRVETASKAAARPRISSIRAESLVRPAARSRIANQILEIAARAVPALGATEVLAEVASVPVAPVEVQALIIEILRRDTASSAINATGYDAFGDQTGPEDGLGVFAFRHDWSQPLVERLEWKTFVERTASGNEQRRALRLVPRRTLRYSVGHGRTTDALVADWMADHMGRAAWWPQPQSAMRLIEPAARGARVLTVDASLDHLQAFRPLLASPTVDWTGIDGWRMGDRWAWIDVKDGWQIARIDDSQNGLLWLVDPLARSAPVGSLVVPLQQGICLEDMSLEQVVPGAAIAEVSVLLPPPRPPWDNLNAPDTSADPILDELPVWPDGNWRDSPRASASATLQVLDNSPADAWVRRADPVRNLTLERRYLVADPDGLLEWQLRLWRTQGQFGSFWLPDGIAPVLSVLEEATPESGYLMVDGPGVSGFWHRPAACVIFDVSGTVLHALTGTTQREVDGRVALVLRSPLDGIVLPGSRVVRLQRCRLAHDAIEFTWHSDALVEISLRAQTLPEPRGNDRSTYYGA